MSTGTRKTDDELKVTQQILRMIGGMTPPARRRVLDYVCSRVYEPQTFIAAGAIGGAIRREGLRTVSEAAEEAKLAEDAVAQAQQNLEDRIRAAGTRARTLATAGDLE